MRRLLNAVLMLFLLLVVSCSKEYSNESGSPISGNNCRINSIASLDSASGIGLYALNTKFNSSNQANYVEIFDSINFSADPRIDLSYTGDTVILGINQGYAVLDGAKRVKRLSVPADASTGQPAVIYDYSYDASGYLTQKLLTIGTIPVPVIKFTYTWAGNDLIRVDGRSNIPGVTQPVFSAIITYDVSKSPKNFMPVYPDGYESILYINALNFGKASAHLLKTITADVYNDQGQLDSTYTTNIKNAIFSPEGYLTEWYADGDGFDPTGLFSGRIKFGYICN